MVERLAPQGGAHTRAHDPVASELVGRSHDARRDMGRCRADLLLHDRELFDDHGAGDVAERVERPAHGAPRQLGVRALVAGDLGEHGTHRLVACDGMRLAGFERSDSLADAPFANREPHEIAHVVSPGEGPVSPGGDDDGRAAAGGVSDGFRFDLFGFATTSTVAASRSHRERVGCGTPTSAPSAIALVARGGVIRCTILFRNPSVYSVTIPSHLAPLGLNSGGGNYPDAGGKRARPSAARRRRRVERSLQLVEIVPTEVVASPGLARYAINVAGAVV